MQLFIAALRLSLIEVAKEETAQLQIPDRQFSEASAKISVMSSKELLDAAVGCGRIDRAFAIELWKHMGGN